MYSLVHSQGLDQDGGIQTEGRMNVEANAVSFCRSIPPERIGLNGEYDHSGLVKRVEQAFRQYFQRAELAHLSITQRGSVVILSGWVLNQVQLDRLIAIALGTFGANYVETHEVQLLEGEQLTSSTSVRRPVTPSLPIAHPIELERRSA